MMASDFMNQCSECRFWNKNYFTDKSGTLVSMAAAQGFGACSVLGSWPENNDPLKFQLYVFGPNQELEIATKGHFGCTLFEVRSVRWVDD